MSEEHSTPAMAETNGEAPSIPDPPVPAIPQKSYSPSTLALHADDRLNQTTDVAPPMHVTTTFRYPSDPSQLTEASELSKDFAHEDLDFIYSRLGSPNTTRLETVLQSLTGGHVLTYSSGLAAFHAMVVYFRPNVIAIGGGYHGCHGVISVLQRLYGLKKVDLFDEKSWDDAGLGKGDIIHVETPVNPTGEAVSLEYFRQKATERGAYLTCDATFAPPPLQDPFKWGVDVIMHSGTKYVGGHSDMLCGVLAVKEKEWWRGMWRDRLLIGGVMGSFEGWLGVRSLRTLELRIMAQSRNAERLVQWLAAALDSQGHGDEGKPIKASVDKVCHASLQKSEMSWIKKQMPNGYGPVFAMWMKSKDKARKLPSKLKLFHHATSLGGVESLIEWRRMSDDSVDDRLVRISVGVENWEDLRDDMLNGFESLSEERTNGVHG